MKYLKKVVDSKAPNRNDTLSYNTLWIREYRQGLNEIFIQKSKNRNYPRWEFIGVEVTKHIEEFWKDESSFVKQATYLFDLDDHELEVLTSRIPQAHS